MNIKVGDIISIRVKVKSKTEEEGNKITYEVKALSGNNYSTMRIESDDIIATNIQVPTEMEAI